MNKLDLEVGIFPSQKVKVFKSLCFMNEQRFPIRHICCILCVLQHKHLIYESFCVVTVLLGKNIIFVCNLPFFSVGGA